MWYQSFDKLIRYVTLRRGGNGYNVYTRVTDPFGQTYWEYSHWTRDVDVATLSGPFQL